MFTLKNGDGMVWPDGKRIAVMVTFDFDAELLRKSVIGKRTIGFSDTSRGQYGPDEGLKRCLDMLERQQLKTTFFVPGRIAELYADKVQQIADAGHELAYHGYLHEASVDMPAAEERENMAKSEELLEKVSGRKVVGYRGPLDLLPNCAMQLMADVLSAAEKEGIAVEKDFYTFSEAELIWRFEKYAEQNRETEFAKLFRTFRGMKKIIRSDIPLDGTYSLSLKVKQRYVDPLVQTEKTGGNAKRISSICPEAKKYIEDFLSYNDSKFGCVEFL